MEVEILDKYFGVPDLSYFAVDSASWGATSAEVLCELPSEASDSAVHHRQGFLAVWGVMQKQYAFGYSSGANRGDHEDAEEGQTTPSRERHHRHHHHHRHRQRRSWLGNPLDLCVHAHSHTKNQSQLMFWPVVSIGHRCAKHT